MGWLTQKTSQTPRPYQTYQTTYRTYPVYHTTPSYVSYKTITPRVEQVYQEIPATQKPTIRQPQRTTSSNVPPPPHGTFDEVNSQCGVQSYKPQETIGLVVNGLAAAKGQVRILKYF